MRLLTIIFIHIRLFFINKGIKDLDRKSKVIDNLLKNISSKNEKISPETNSKIIAMAIAIYSNRTRYIAEVYTLKLTLIKLGAD